MGVLTKMLIGLLLIGGGASVRADEIRGVVDTEQQSLWRALI